MSSGIKTTVESAIVPQWTLGRDVRLPQCTVVVESGPDAGKRFGPLREVTTIGREIYCDIGLSDTAVSKVHCELSWTDQGLRLRDLGSTNGTKSLETEVWDLILPPDKTFKIGESTLRVEIEGSIHTFRSCPMDETSKLAGASPPMRSLFAAMERVAQQDVPVLILGETGTGKTAIARAIHDRSARSQRPFVSANCAAFPAELAEAMLFGHVKGAFTGAEQSKPGLLQQAAGGTLLLDEIGDMPLALQAKLLTVLGGSVRPVGSDKEVPVNFRLICATNRDLKAEVDAGRFRRDLYFRIAGIVLTVPPLRARMADIPMLAELLTFRIGEKIRASGCQCRVTGISRDAIRDLGNHSWPGNVRELENVIESAMTIAEGSTIEADDLTVEPWTAPSEGMGSAQSDEDKDPATVPDCPVFAHLRFKEWKEALLETHQREYFQQVLERAGGNVTKAAELAGVARSYMKTVIKKYGLTP